MDENAGDDGEQREQKVTEICDRALEIIHERVFTADKKKPLSIKELKDMMFIVREAHYLTTEFLTTMDLADLSGRIISDRELEDEGNDDDEDEDDYGDSDFDDEDDDGPDINPGGPFGYRK